ncbi:hypothetical protein GEV33_005729 [Tenebrio molitor]|uniref:Uncharacterized protein n=1 Tax=Tenebrio molitor TaxID=7067 RepID=A0A8J6HML6_TENMO|nr:hypothetical protein GEV33_005729 [Tenebrio molitor]
MLNVRVYGKLNERFDKWHYTTVATKAEDLLNLNSNYVDRIIHGEYGDVVLFEFSPKKIRSKRPIFAIFSVLELSKMRMYQFHYDVMVKKYGKRLKLLRLNTDNFIYEIETEDFNKDLGSDPRLLAEFVPEGHLSKRKPEEVLGKMRDESGGKKICKLDEELDWQQFIPNDQVLHQGTGDLTIKRAPPNQTRSFTSTIPEQHFARTGFPSLNISITPKGLEFSPSRKRQRECGEGLFGLWSGRSDLYGCGTVKGAETARKGCEDVEGPKRVRLEEESRKAKPRRRRADLRIPDGRFVKNQTPECGVKFHARISSPIVGPRKVQVSRDVDRPVTIKARAERFFFVRIRVIDLLVTSPANGWSER